MTTIQFLAVVSAVAINTAIPGPAIIHVFSRGAASGFGAGARVAAGMAGGSVALALVAYTIMVGVLSISEEAFGFLKWGGAVVLALLGLHLLRTAGRADAKSISSVRCRGADFLCGLLLAASSPPNLIFMLALLPQFLPEDLKAVNLGSVVAAVIIGTLIPTKATALIGARTCQMVSACWIERLGAASMLGFAGIAVAISI
jgi:threonine/homoserine/homoserine lactone efflux protein